MAKWSRGPRPEFRSRPFVQRSADGPSRAPLSCRSAYMKCRRSLSECRGTTILTWWTEKNRLTQSNYTKQRTSHLFVTRINEGKTLAGLLNMMTRETTAISRRWSHNPSGKMCKGEFTFPEKGPHTFELDYNWTWIRLGSNFLFKSQSNKKWERLRLNCINILFYRGSIISLGIYRATSWKLEAKIM